MRVRNALRIFAVGAVALGGLAEAQEKPSATPAPSPAESICPDAITASAQYGATQGLEQAERKEVEARLREVAGRVSTEAQVRQQLTCLMRQ